MATIELRSDRAKTNMWWLIWVEHNEVVGQVSEISAGTCVVTPRGSRWSPMKSFSQTFASPDEALHEVQLYFARQ